MKWHEITITTSKEASHAVSDMLISRGSNGVVIEDPEDIKKGVLMAGPADYIEDALLEDKGNDVIVRAYFPDNLSPSELTLIMKKNLRDISKFLHIGKGVIDCICVDDEDWGNSWKKYYRPFSLCENVVVKPTWEQYEAVNGETVVEIDPGMAFGTGMHETTKMSAAFLKKHVKQGFEIIDVGSGTCILSIVAAKLGASGVIALDNDENAVRAAQINLKINGVQDIVKVYNGEIDSILAIGARADIVVANIVADVIMGISEKVKKCLKAGGIFITSGIIAERGAEVIRYLSHEGFLVSEQERLGEWMAIVFKCQDSL